MRTNKSRNSRNENGVAVILLLFILGFFFIGVIGVFTFEIARLNTAHDELRSACEAAALSGTAVLASSNSTNPTVSHNNAVSAALATFQQNSVVGVSLASATQTANNNDAPAPGANSLYIEFLDPNNNNAVVTDYSSSAGKLVHVIGAEGYIPAFAKYVGIQSHDIRADAMAAVPALDVVLCFDCSASIDDQTPVTLVHRYMNSQGKVAYMFYDQYHDGNTTNLKSGQLYTAINCTKATGSAMNAMPPQNLSSVKDTTNNNFTFDGQHRSNGGADYGTPPTSGYTPQSGYFTDEVVNLDGNLVFNNGNDNGSFTVGGKAFPNLATLVEAARGNLENQTVFVNSGASSAVRGVPASVANNLGGYQAAYLAAAHSLCAPIGPAQQAALSFMNIMNTNTDAHFGYISFATAPYTGPGNGDGGAIIDGGCNSKSYWYKGASVTGQNWPVTGTPLSSTASNFSTIATPAGSSAIETGIANGGTDIGDSVATAAKMLLPTTKGGQSRVNAKRVIVFFTDGLANGGNTDPWSAATTMSTNGSQTAIYTIGLAQNSNVIQPQVDCLNSGGQGSTISYTDPITGQPATVTCGRDGISKIAKNNGQFFLVTNVANLNYVFENIARQLVTLVRN
ncbi:MAG: VWA domain-containing protein [Candidatus Obscuribacterales bacterium]|nr:VWA domain-containing protein [Candidatus Obscuribacterales bacterium]